MKYIVDANVVIKWFRQESEEDISSARDLYSLMIQGKIELHAPTYLIMEVINILYWRIKIGSIPLLKIARKIRNGGIMFDYCDDVVALTDDIEKLMTKYNLTSYDSIYLGLAIKKNCKLLTFDKKLLQIKRHCISPRDLQKR